MPVGKRTSMRILFVLLLSMSHLILSTQPVCGSAECCALGIALNGRYCCYDYSAGSDPALDWHWFDVSVQLQGTVPFQCSAATCTASYDAGSSPDCVVTLSCAEGTTFNPASGQCEITCAGGRRLADSSLSEPGQHFRRPVLA